VGSKDYLNQEGGQREAGRPVERCWDAVHPNRRATDELEGLHEEKREEIGRE